jgi:DNA-binding NtrC family response regulator
MPLAAPAFAPASALAATNGVAVVVGDHQPARDAAQFLTEESWRVERVLSVEEEGAEARLRDASVVIVDAGAVAEPLGAAMEHLRDICPEAAAILLTDRDSPRPDFAGLGPGRPRMVSTPVRRDSLLTALEAELGYRSLLRENRILRDELRAATRLADWVGCSAEAGEIRSGIITTAFSDAPVLVIGEPGSGRRLAAELIHRLGRQSSLPFLPLQAANLAAGGLGPILARLRSGNQDFGSAFLPTRPGSLYLSGVERLGPADQASLDDAVRRPPPFRLIVSAIPDLRARTQSGTFARALYKRLQTSTIRIPPLRERREDIPALLLHFLKKACEASGDPPFGLSGATVEAYGAYHWPGNTAELRMWVERAVATARVSRFSGTVLPETLSAPPDGGTPRTANIDSRPLKEVIAEIEKRLIERALRRTRGNQKRAAQALQMNPTTLHEKMKRHGLLRKAARETNLE